ncbi:lysozyme [Nocardioides daedukensis]|uniref:Lysozyme n=1 Tax=Nocardioides daedukensis TaxID=634462 RepID=A0A7Y9UVW1_9ACTN|nr:GH25 family lysozyme [Nocardioides daedukensis]NYG59265.1 lysozyme [Nocardioides daedukensis]
MRYAVLLAAALSSGLVLAGCGGQDAPVAVQPGERATPTVSATPTVRPSASPTSSPTGSRDRKGIDVSQHQGDIDWERVAADGVEFAYLKATEGSGFSDPRFVSNARAAKAAGIEVGAYHYYTLCAAPEPQAAHFVSTITGATDLAPVVDLELIGNCDPPPDPVLLQKQVQRFIALVEEASEERVVVYFHPGFEAFYSMVAEFDRPLWVRRVGTVPPPGEWHIWQRNDRGTVDGIDGPVDLNLMRNR